MDDVALPQGFQQQVVSGLGQVGQALLGADEGGWAHFQLAVCLQEIADSAVTDTQAMFHLGGHGQDDRAEGVACGAQGIGGLLRMPALPALPAGGAGARVDVELGDNRYDGRQVRLILDDLVQLIQGAGEGHGQT
jgi:hypothetical protein